SVLINNSIAIRRQSAAQSHIRIQHAILVKVDNAQKVRATNFSVGRLYFSVQQAQQRGFAASVWTHQPNALACGEDEIKIGKKHPSANLVAYVVKLHQPLGLAI